MDLILISIVIIVNILTWLILYRYIWKYCRKYCRTCKGTIFQWTESGRNNQTRNTTEVHCTLHHVLHVKDKHIKLCICYKNIKYHFSV